MVSCKNASEENMNISLTRKLREIMAQERLLENLQTLYKLLLQLEIKLLM